MRFRTGMLALVFVTAASVSPIGSAHAHAQGPPAMTTVEPVRDLRFGPLIPGHSLRIRTGDDGRGELQVEGRGQYQLRFILPEALISAEGASLPVHFGTGDAVLILGTAGARQAFNPHDVKPVMFTGEIGEAVVLLGGTADPRPKQPAGVYTANITILLARN